MKRTKQAAAAASDRDVWLFEWRKALASGAEAAAERMAEELARRRPLRDVARAFFGKKREKPLTRPISTALRTRRSCAFGGAECGPRTWVF